MEKAAEGIDGETRREFLPPNCHPLGSRRWLLPQAAIGPNQLWVHYVRCDDIELAEDSAERDEESPPVFLPCHPLPRFCEAGNQQSALSNKGLLRGWVPHRFYTGQAHLYGAQSQPRELSGVQLAVADLKQSRKFFEPRLIGDGHEFP